STWPKPRGEGRDVAGTALLVLEAHDRCRLVSQIDDRKSGGIQAARRTVLGGRKLEAAVTRPQGEGAAPGQDRIAAPDRASRGIPRFRIAVERARVPAQVRAHALAGI